MNLFDVLGFGPKGWGATLLVGLLVTVLVSVVALLLGSVFGSLIAWAKLSKNTFARIIGEAYTTIFRGVPELLIIYLFYFGGSSFVSMVAHAMGFEGFYDIPPFLAGSIAVGMISGSYQTEVYRGAYVAIARGELEAATAVGMGKWLKFRRIIVPQVLRFAIPGLGNVWQLTLKDSALVSVTGIADLMRQSSVAAGSTKQHLVFYTVAGLLYLLLTSISGYFFNTAEARATRGLRRSA